MVMCVLSHFSSVVSVTLCDSMDRSPPGASVHGILQARILEGVVISFSGDLPHPGMEPMSLTSPALAGRFLASSATWEARENWSGLPCPYPGDLPDPGMEPGSPALPADSLPLRHQVHLCMFQCYSLKPSHPPLLPLCSQACPLCLSPFLPCIFLDSTYMC